MSTVETLPVNEITFWDVAQIFLALLPARKFFALFSFALEPPIIEIKLFFFSFRIGLGTVESAVHALWKS